MKRESSTAVPHRTQGSVLDDLGFTPEQSLELKVKADLFGDLLAYIRERGYTQQQLIILLGMHQPDVSLLLSGRVSRFSVGRLLKLAGRLHLGASVKLTRPDGKQAA